MRIFLYIVVFCVLFVLYVRYLERTSLFYPSKDIALDPGHTGLTFEDVYFQTSDNLKLHAWFIPTEKTKPVLLFFHGNAGNISDRLEKIKEFHGMGLNVFIFDYRGYGKSEGKPSEKGMYIDGQAAYDYLLTRENVLKDKIVVYGASLGGSAAVDLLTKRDAALLIVDSTFSNAIDMAKRYYPFIPSFLVSIKLDSLSKIKRIKAPALFIHSKDDQTVPYELGRKLYEAANEPKKFIETRGDHNDGHFYDAEEYLGGIQSFLKMHNLL